jgi:hypothetical protein
MNKRIKLSLFLFVTSLLALIVLVFSLASAHTTAQERLLTQVQKLTASDAANVTKTFSYSLALEADTAIVGAPEQDDYVGAVYVFNRINGDWEETQKLSDDIYGRGHNFGAKVALDGDTLLVGTDMELSGSPGEAHVFTRDTEGWTEKQTLTSSDGQVHDRFGFSVAIEGDMALIGAPYHNQETGTVFVFTRENGVWQEHQKIQLPNTPSPMLFGYDVQMDGEYAIISARGETTDQGQAYIYRLVNGEWLQQQKLTEIDLSIPRYYGPIVGIQGDRALVATFNVRPGVEVFKRDDNQWVSEQVLYWGPRTGGFGWSFRIDDETIVVSAPFAGDNEQGAAYVFRYIDGLWRQYTYLSPDDIQKSARFGQAVEIEGRTVLVGSMHSDPETGTGTVYVYDDPELVATETTVPPTFTHTPDDPSTPIPPTPTNTPLPDGTVELLVNGGFEIDADANQVPDGWNLKRASDDKLKCNTDDKAIAFEGACVFQFKRSDAERSKLLQDVDLAAHAVSVSNTLTLSGQVWAKGDVDSKATLKVKYASLPTDKLTFNIVSTAKQWTAFSALQPNLLITLADTPSKIILQLKHQSPSGKVRYDALSLIQQSTTLVPLGFAQ